MHDRFGTLTRTFQIGAISAANIGSTILFNWVVLVGLGPGVKTDALFAGMTIPQIFTWVIGASLTQALAPLLAGEPKEEQLQDAWTLITSCTLLFAAVAAILAGTAKWWVPWTVPGFTAEGKALATLFAQIGMFGIIFTGINAIQTALAFAQGRFVWSDAAPTLASVMSLALLVLLLPVYGAIAAAWMTVFRLLLQTLLLARGMGPPCRPNFARPSVGLLWKRLKPLIAGASYYKLDPLVDRFLVSALAPGSLSLLYLAQQLHSAASQVITKAWAIPAITRLAIAHKAGDSAQFGWVVRSTILAMTAAGGGGVLALLLVGKPVLAALMTHGQFQVSDSYTLWWILLLLSGLLVGGSIGAFTSGIFYSIGNTLTPTWIGSLSFTIAILIKVAAFRLFALDGLAVAISFYYLMSLAMMLSALYRHGLLAGSEAPIGEA